jgi:hypothetical protein
VIHKVARYNGGHSSLTIEKKETESDDVTAAAEHSEGNYVGNVVRQHLSNFDSNHVYPLFAGIIALLIPYESRGRGSL